MSIKFVKDYNKEAVIYNDKTYTYKDLISEAKYCSSLLKINPEDKVVIFMENRPQFISTFFGVWNSKALPINLDAGYNVEELLYVLLDASPSYIITSNKNFLTAKKAVDSSNKNIHIINIDEVFVPKDFQVDEYSIYSPEPMEPAVLLYTSGTTGNPKGVVLTFDNLMSNMDAITEIEIATSKDRLLALLPYHHVLPLSINLLMAIHLGTLIVLLDELSGPAILGALQKYKITIVVGVPRLWEMIHKGLIGKIKASKVATLLFNLCKKVGSKGLSKIIFKKVHEALGGNIRYLVSGGAKIDPTIIDDFKVFGITVLEGYGLTETSPIISFNRPHDIKIGTVGKVIPGVEVRLTEDGELLARGRNVFKEYYNKPEATLEAKDAEGWFKTGDLATIEDDYITIVGRKKEMIVLSNGKNINPVEIENEIIQGTDLIKEIAVIESKGHLLSLVYPDFALIKERGISNIAEALKWEIVDSYNIKAPAYKKVLEIKIVKDELPKTKLGKLRRFMLKDVLKDLEEGRAKEKVVEKREGEWLTVEFTTLEDYLRQEKGIDITPNDHIEIDLGLDSLDIIQMNSFIEKTFGFTIKDEEAVDLKVIKDITAYIRKNSNSFNLEEMNWGEFLKEDIDFKFPDSKMIGFVKLLFSPIIKLYLGLQVVGREKLSKNEPRIIICNHESFVDSVIVPHVFTGDMIKKTYFFALKKHFDNPTFTFIAKHSNVILMDLNQNLKESLQMAGKVLREGNNLLIFPEGARSRNGELQEFKKFFAILSKELNIPVTVLGLDGAFEALPFGARMIRRSKLYIEVIQDIDPSNLTIEEIVSTSKGVIKDWKDKRRSLKTK